MMQDTTGVVCAQARGGDHDRLYHDVRRRRDIGASAKVIFCRLMTLTERGEHPSVRRLARECGCSANTAAKAVRELRDAGLVGWVPRGTGRTYHIIYEGAAS